MAFSYDGNDLGYDLEVVLPKREAPVKNVQSFGDEIVNQVTYSCDPLGQVRGNQINVDLDGSGPNPADYVDIPPTPAGYTNGPVGGQFRKVASRGSTFDANAAGNIYVDTVPRNGVLRWVHSDGPNRGDPVGAAPAARPIPPVQQRAVLAAETANMNPGQELRPGQYPEGGNPAPGRIYVRVNPTGDVPAHVTRVSGLGNLWGTKPAPAIAPTHPGAPGAPRANAAPAIPAGSPPSYPHGETTFRQRLSSSGLNPAEVELYMQGFSTNPRTRPGEISRQTQALDRDTNNPADSAHRGQRIWNVDNLRVRINTQQTRSAWTALLDKGATPDNAVRFMESQGWSFERSGTAGTDRDHPPVLIGRRNLLDNTTPPLTPEDRSDFARMTETIRSSSLNAEGINAQSQRQEDVNAYLNTFTDQAGRQQAVGTLQRMDYIDSRGQVRGTWTHEQFGRTFYNYAAGDAVPAGALGGTRHEARTINSNSLTTFQQALQTGLSATPPNLTEARRVLADADPITRATGERLMTQALVEGDPHGNPPRPGGVHQVLTSPPYSFSGPDAHAIEVSRGLRNPDGTIPADLAPTNALSEFTRLSGSSRPIRDEIQTTAIQWFRQRHEDGMHRIGMNGETAARFMAGRRYLGRESELPAGTLGRMMQDHAAMEATKGDRHAAAELGRRFINETRGDTIPQPGSPEGNQALLIRNRVQGQPGQRLDPAVQQARQELHTSDEATRERQGRVGREERTLGQRDRELDISAGQLRVAEGQLQATQQRNANDAEQFRMTDARERWATQARLDQDRDEGQKNREAQAINALIAAFAQLIGGAMQAMTAVYQTSGQGLQAVNQSIFSRLGGGGR